MKRKHLVIFAIVIVAIALTGSGFAIKNSIKAQIKESFKLNEELKSEGYYMAEFEFKMLGCAYYLDKGQYITALSRLNRIHKQLKTREGLIREPKFADQKEKLEFYLSLQNPKTGAFMEDGYPLFACIGPTLNVVNLIEDLSGETGQQLRLKYPLLFLDGINTTEKLKAFLDDVSSVGWIGARFRTPYIEAAELAASIDDLETLGLYTFSPEWKKTLLQWFYDNQDSKTGYWGVKMRGSGELLNSGDLLATEKIVKLFVDSQGNDCYPGFPLRYRNEMFRSTLQRLSQPMPANLDEMHEWVLATNRGTRLLTRYLWNGASPENIERARKLMESAVINKYEKFYIEHEGAFSLYQGAEHADLDGTGETLGYLDAIGALSGEKQKFLWGPQDKNILDLGVYKVSQLKESDFTAIKNCPEINSIRLYLTDPGPGDYAAGVACVYYPKETPVPDILDLLPKVTRWVNGTSQNMGNWVTKEDIQHELAMVKIQPVPVAKGDFPAKTANELLHKYGKLTVVGFNVLQAPTCKMTFHNKLKN